MCAGREGFRGDPQAGGKGTLREKTGAQAAKALGGLFTRRDDPGPCNGQHLRHGPRRSHLFAHRRSLRDGLQLPRHRRRRPAGQHFISEAPGSGVNPLCGSEGGEPFPKRQPLRDHGAGRQARPHRHESLHGLPEKRFVTFPGKLRVPTNIPPSDRLGESCLLPEIIKI